MNRLDYRSNPDDFLAFELIVDREPLVKRVGGSDTWIPYWLFKSSLPEWGPSPSGTYIVGVCSCGEYGCGHTRCEVQVANDRVVFSRFLGDASSDYRDAVFTFTRANYDAVVAAILAEVESHRGA